MTEQWHSLELEEDKPLEALSLFVFYVVFLFLMGAQIFLEIELIYTLKILVFYFAAFIVCIIGGLVKMKKYDLIQDVTDYTEGEAYLDYSKTLILWNLEEAARLKIVTKLQDPFRFFNPDEGEEFESFDVETKDILSRL